MTKLKTTDVKGKPYVEVAERLRAFRSEKQFEGYSLESEIVNFAGGVITIKAVIKTPDGRVIATGLAQEKESSSYINKTSFVENCETSAWGRALGNLGIGIDTSVCSYEEVSNAILNQEKQPAWQEKQPAPAPKTETEMTPAEIAEATQKAREVFIPLLQAKAFSEDEASEWNARFEKADLAGKREIFKALKAA